MKQLHKLDAGCSVIFTAVYGDGKASIVAALTKTSYFVKQHFLIWLTQKE